MTLEANPYQPPAASITDEPVSTLERPAIGRTLLLLWTIEGSVKAYLTGKIFLAHGFSAVQFLANGYSGNRIVFFLVSVFMMVETIGPWIGIYYLTGRRARTIPLGDALWRTLKLAGGIALLATVVLMMYLELTASRF